MTKYEVTSRPYDAISGEALREARVEIVDTQRNLLLGDAENSEDIKTFYEAMKSNDLITVRVEKVSALER